MMPMKLWLAHPTPTCAGDVHALALNLIESLFAAADGLEMFGDAVLVGGKVVEGSGYRFIDGS